ncbi:hypothetical protein EDB82DRAFT_469804 [Fusarium venenatum]|uniref:uncharacterized protein n=1 Tax=Fusarium venenatum TaxID=56646 RepID=UPI001DC4496F|nr:hypothetical protein EDB82DRAFT_469804 [Fusarium venenatum]
MKAAIRFIMDLERSHTQIGKSLPSRTKFYNYYVNIEQEAEKLGWDTYKHGKLLRPFCVLTPVYPCGRRLVQVAGAVRHAQTVVKANKYMGATRRKVPLENHWWWYDFECETSGTLLALGVILFWLLCWIG